MRSHRRYFDLDRILVICIRVGSLLILLMPLVVTRQTLFPFVVGKALFARATIEIIFGLWLLLAYRNPHFRLARSWVLLAFGIYLAVTILAGIVGVSLQRSLWSTYERMQGIVDLLHWFALTIVLTSVFRTFPDWRTLLNLNLGVSFVVALLGAAQHLGIGVPMFKFMQDVQRLDITLGNPTYVGAYALVNTFVALGLLVHSFQGRQPTSVTTARQRRLRSRRRRGARADEESVWLPWLRLFWTVAAALNLWILWLTETRGALFGLVAGFVAFGIGYLIWGRVRTLKLVALSMIAIVLGVSLFLVLANEFEPVKRLARSSGMVERFTNISLDDASIRARVSSWSVGLDGFAARPILGWGPENYISAWGRYFVESSDVEQRRVQERFDQAHNKLLEELTTKGVVGLWSYMGLWALMFWFISRRAKRQDPQVQIATLFIGAALTGYFVQNLFLFDTPATVLQFILLLGFVVGLEATSEEPAEQAAGRSHEDPIPSGGQDRRLGMLWRRVIRPSESWLGSSTAQGLAPPAVERTFGSERFSATF